MWEKAGGELEGAPAKVVALVDTGADDGGDTVGESVGDEVWAGGVAAVKVVVRVEVDRDFFGEAASADRGRERKEKDWNFKLKTC
jgi:hypothetical protein